MEKKDRFWEMIYQCKGCGERRRSLIITKDGLDLKDDMKQREPLIYPCPNLDGENEKDRNAEIEIIKITELSEKKFMKLKLQLEKYVE
jgi:hypothetical protein